MAYGEWSIGGLTPNWLITADYSQLNNRKIVLNCLAEQYGANDPRVEVAAFEALLCEGYSNDPLLGGGSCLQVLGGDKLQLTDGVNSWTAALVDVAYVEESFADRAIEFTLTFEVETQPKGGFAVYTPSYDEYGNLDYSSTYCNGVRGDLSPDGHEAHGNELGYLKITEARDIRRVEMKGSGCVSPASITVNGVSQEWHYYHDQGLQGLEKLTFDLDPVTNEVVITATHEGGCENRGAWLHWIRVWFV